MLGLASVMAISSPMVYANPFENTKETTKAPEEALEETLEETPEETPDSDNPFNSESESKEVTEKEAAAPEEEEKGGFLDFLTGKTATYVLLGGAIVLFAVMKVLENKKKKGE